MSRAAATIQSADGTIKLEISKDDTAKTISITDRYGNLPSECELVLPESVTINDDAYTVTSIGNSAFARQSVIISLTLPSTITSIGNSAFMSCTSLASVDFLACTSLTSIGEDAFSYTALTSVTLPASLTSIGSSAFYKCTDLKVVTFLATAPPTLDGSVSTVFSNCSSLTAVYVPADSLNTYTEKWGNTFIIGSKIVKIQAIVKESMTLTPDSESWSGEYGTDFESKTFTIANVGEDALTNISVELGGDNAGSFTLDTAGMANSLDAKGQTTFTVTPKADLGVGTYNATVTVTATVNGETETKEATLTCTVNAKSLTGAAVSVSGEYTYDGSEIVPDSENVTVTLDGEPLTADDYTLSYENNTDAGTATVKATGKGNYSGTATGSFTINKATPTVTGVAVSDSIGTIYDTTDISTITLTHGDSDTPGTVKLDDGQTLTTGSGTYNWTFTPSNTTNYTTATGKITLTVEADTLEKIEVTTAPSKTEYTYGENFDKTGMVVTATYLSNATKDVTDDVTISPETLTVGVTEVTISYGGKTTTQAITVNPKVVSSPIIELSGTSFEYTGSEIKPTVTVKDGDTVIPESEYTVEYSNNTNVGTATVTIKDVEGGNYTVSGSTTFEITKAKATVTTAPEAVTGLTYDGQPHALVTAGEAIGGTMQYSTEENGAYSTDIPTGTDVGTYTVWYKVMGDDNHSDTQPVKLEVTIAGVSIDGAVVTLTPESSTYTGSEQRPTVTVTLDSQDLDGDTDYEVSYDPTEVKNAGTYTVTVTGTGNYEGTATATFTIQKADPNIGDVTYSGGDLYDSTALDSITLNRGNSDIDGTLKLDAGQTLRADVSSYKWTFTPDDADNYETVTGTVQLTVQADALTGLSVQTNPDKTEYVYGDFFDKTGLVLEATYESGNTKNISEEEITIVTTGPLTCDMEKVTVSYQGMECQVPVTVNKATYSGQTTVTGTIWANTASEVQLPQPPDGATFGDPVYSVGSDTVVRVEITGNTLAYEGGSGITKGQEYEITVPVNGGTNYENYTITVTLIGTDKKVPTGAPTLSTTTITYGQSLSTITLSGSMQDGAETVTGTFTWDAPTTTPDAGSYEAHWTFTPTDGNLYVSVSGTTTITVNKATPTGTPKYTAITTSGKTLADANLTTEGGTFSVPGTVTWELADTTQVQANTAYTWKFTPDDSDNYNSISGSVTLYTVSSGGGGGGGSSSSNITTETTKNPDGSTTTTVTNKNTGTVTETTTWPDGSKTEVVEEPDGTVTTTTTDTTGNKTQVVENPDGSSQTTVTNKDGSGSVTLVDENGQVVSEATLSQSAVAAAQEKGEAVALPMPSVPVTSDRENAPTVTVDLPVGGSVQVEIPVEDVTTSTVAVIVKADGTEEVIKTSLTTENGVAVTLSDGDTVKVVDNSKTFDDVSDNYWGTEAVTFASSRELFAGTSATTFAPDTAMTRGMIVTVLARFEGVDTTTGSTWYEAGQQWAVENGISDGTNMDASLTREQLATMLYRYAQSKGYDTTQGGMAVREYADFEQISDYAVEAMTWAVNTGLISGTSTTTLSPQGEATRAQVATILMRFIEGNQ